MNNNADYASYDVEIMKYKANENFLRQNNINTNEIKYNWASGGVHLSSQDPTNPMRKITEDCLFLGLDQENLNKAARLQDFTYSVLPGDRFYEPIMDKATGKPTGRTRATFRAKEGVGVVGKAKIINETQNGATLILRLSPNFANANGAKFLEVTYQLNQKEQEAGRESDKYQKWIKAFVPIAQSDLEDNSEDFFKNDNFGMQPDEHFNQQQQQYQQQQTQNQHYNANDVCNDDDFSF